METLAIFAAIAVVLGVGYLGYQSGVASYRKGTARTELAKKVMDNAYVVAEKILAEHDLDQSVEIGKEVLFGYDGTTLRYSLGVSCDVLNMVAVAQALKDYKDGDAVVTVESLDDVGNFRINALHGYRFREREGRTDAFLTSPV